MRFVTEDTYPGRVAQYIRFRADDRAFLIIDDEINETTELSPASKNVLSQLHPAAVSDDIEELERETGLPEGSLVATLALYNRHAANGHDPVLHKQPHNIKPLRPPYGVFDLSHASRGFTLGGLRTTTDSEVLHVSGEPIPGLYAAGRTASGIPVWGYASGASLGDGSFFGRRAGRNAAASRG
jgi:3-oxo-5alpha-steroid 4-dehydrogenase